MLRSIGAVVAGYFIFAASAVLLFQLSGRDTHADAPLAFMAAATIWGAVFRWSGSRRTCPFAVHSRALVAALIALGAIVSIVARLGRSGRRCPLVAMAPCAARRHRVLS
jgi:hypothetical protein